MHGVCRCKVFVGTWYLSVHGVCRWIVLVGGCFSLHNVGVKCLSVQLLDVAWCIFRAWCLSVDSVCRRIVILSAYCCRCMVFIGA